VGCDVEAPRGLSLRLVAHPIAYPALRPAERPLGPDHPYRRSVDRVVAARLACCCESDGDRAVIAPPFWPDRRAAQSSTRRRSWALSATRRCSSTSGPDRSPDGAGRPMARVRGERDGVEPFGRGSRS
jgi:hypothetical protein